MATMLWHSYSKQLAIMIVSGCKVWTGHLDFFFRALVSNLPALLTVGFSGHQLLLCTSIQNGQLAAVCRSLILFRTADAASHRS